MIPPEPPLTRQQFFARMKITKPLYDQNGEQSCYVEYKVTFRQWLTHHLKGFFFRFHISRRGVFLKCRFRQQRKSDGWGLDRSLN